MTTTVEVAIGIGCSKTPSRVNTPALPSGGSLIFFLSEKARMNPTINDKLLAYFFEKLAVTLDEIARDVDPKFHRQLVHNKRLDLVAEIKCPFDGPSLWVLT
jgi:hypothetical protein